MSKHNAARVGTTEVLELDRSSHIDVEIHDDIVPAKFDPRELAHKRWGINWHEVPVLEGNQLLGDLKEEFERAAKIMQQRQQAALVVSCHCGCGVELLPGRACMSRTLKDEKTQLPYNVYFATQECVRQQNKKQYGLAEMIK